MVGRVLFPLHHHIPDTELQRRDHNNLNQSILIIFTFTMTLPLLLDSNDAVVGPIINEPQPRPVAIIIHEEDDEVEALEVEALALVDDDMRPEDNNVIRPERNVVRRPVVEPALRPFRDFANLRRRSDHPGPALHITILGTKRTSERLLARTRCFRLAPRTMPFEESYNEWGPPLFPVLDADEESDNKSLSLAEDDDE